MTGNDKDSDLGRQKCEPCERQTEEMDLTEEDKLFGDLSGWSREPESGVRKLVKTYRFGNFVEAIQFANYVKDISEKENHHPSLLIEWGRVTVSWWTHTAGGLRRNDYIMAAKTDLVYSGGEGTQAGCK